MLADSWKDLPEFVARASSDAGFHAFVLRHVDDQHGGEPLEKIRTHAKRDCPREATSICGEIADRASEVIAQLRAIQPR